MNNLIIVMGVSGTGKSSVASYLASALHYVFIDADDFHDENAKAMMANNVSITDDMRQAWVNRLCHYIKQHHQAPKSRSLVLAYSGLKVLHREQFRQIGLKTQFIYLQGSSENIRQRMKTRQNHFVDASFLHHQLRDFEAIQTSEVDVSQVNIDVTFEQVCAQSLAALEPTISTS